VAASAFTHCLRQLEAAGGTAAQRRTCQVNLADAQCRLGLYGEAEALYRAADPSSDDADICSALGWALVMQGKLPGGAAMYERAEQLLLAADRSVSAGEARPGLGRIVTLDHPSSTLYQIR
jgi:tetratricopeptide (TPR) repeat protein